MFWLKFISKFIKVLRSGESPPLIAGGFTMGFIVGLTPFWTLQNVLLIMIAILTRINLAAMFFALFLFSFVAFIFDPIFHDLGFAVLVNVEGLKSLWTAMYNWPVAPFTRFYNTVVMGSLLTGLVLAFPVYLLAQKGVVAYRASWAEKIEQSKFVKSLRSSTLVQWYIKLRDMSF